MSKRTNLGVSVLFLDDEFPHVFYHRKMIGSVPLFTDFSQIPENSIILLFPGESNVGAIFLAARKIRPGGNAS